MTALVKRFVTKMKLVRTRSRSAAADVEEALPLLERFLSAYWPETRTERTIDALGAAALSATAPGRRNWIFTPVAGLRSFAPGDELGPNYNRGWWGDTEAPPNDAAIGSVAGAYGRSRPRPSTAAIG